MSQSLYTRLARRHAPQRFTMSRRDLLKATLAASAGLLLSNCASNNGGFSRGTRNIQRRVIVIGAGFAGLACAHELSAVGYDVVVLEARNRVGGRVLSFTDMVPGKAVEGGGEYIGTNHPTWVAYAAKFGLNLKEIPDEKDLDEPLMLEGRVLDNAEAKKIFEEMDTAFEKLNDAARDVNENEPWKTPNAAAMDSVTMAEWLASLQVAPLTKRAIRAELEANESVALEKQSFLAFITMVKGGGVEKYWTDTENCHCAQGNQALAQAMADKLIPLSVNLRTPIVRIAHGPSGVLVTTADNREFRGDDLVLTVPPNLWKNIHFTPKLPAELDVQMGMAVKYLSAVKGKFWRAAKLSANSLSDGDVSMTWDGTAGQGDSGEGELTCFSGGPAAEHARSRPPGERRAFYGEHLAKMYAGYADNVESTRFMDWPADPWAMASYSFAAPKQITTAGPILSSGIDRLHFAGEYTCFKFCGYMEGGLNSGVAAARRIAMRDGVVK